MKMQMPEGVRSLAIAGFSATADQNGAFQAPDQFVPILRLKGCSVQHESRDDAATATDDVSIEKSVE